MTFALRSRKRWCCAGPRFLGTDSTMNRTHRTKSLRIDRSYRYVYCDTTMVHQCDESRIQELPFCSLLQ